MQSSGMALFCCQVQHSLPVSGSVLPVRIWVVSIFATVAGMSLLYSCMCQGFRDVRFGIR